MSVRERILQLLLVLPSPGGLSVHCRQRLISQLALIAAIRLQFLPPLLLLQHVPTTVSYSALLSWLSFSHSSSSLSSSQSPLFSMQSLSLLFFFFFFLISLIHLYDTVRHCYTLTVRTSRIHWSPLRAQSSDVARQILLYGSGGERSSTTSLLWARSRKEGHACAMAARSRVRA